MRVADVRSRSVIAVLAFTLSTFGIAQRAFAQDAEAIIARGVELRHAGQDEAALAEFRHAYEIAHSPRALAQVALAEQALGRWAAAERDLALAIRETGDPWIARNLEVLQSAMPIFAQHLGSLIVTSNVESGGLFVNGERAATLPMSGPVRVEIGTVAIEVRAAGYATARRTIEVQAGMTVRESLYSMPASDDADRASSGPPSSSPARSNASVAPPAPAAPPSMLPTVGAGALVAGAVLLVSGAGAQAYWQNRVAVYNDDSQCFYGGFARSVRCGAVLDNANAGESVMIGLYVTGGVVAAVGAVLFLATRSAHTRGVASAIPACAAGLGAREVSCAWRF